MATTTELREKALRIAHEARAKLNDITDSTPAARASEIEAEFDRMMADADALEARAARIEKADGFEAELNAADPRRPTLEDRSISGTFTYANREERHDAVFNAYLRGLPFNGAMQAAEFRDQSVGTNSAGGYLVPTTLVDALVKALKYYGPMMDDAAVNHLRTATGNPMNWPTMDDTANAGRLVTEANTISTASLAFGQKTLNAYKYTSDFIKISSELLQDSALNVGEIVIEAIAERLGRIVNTHLTNGTGSAQPNGLITAIGTPSLTTVGNAVVAYDDIVELIHSVDPAYRKAPKTQFMLSDAALKAVRKLKDSQGHPLWEPSLTVGAPASLLGYAYQINSDMAAVATGNVPIIFGDMSKYLVRVAKDVSVRRADERFIDNDQVAFVGFLRVDGNLMDAKAIKGLKVS